jgi:hypothetical protein
MKQMRILPPALFVLFAANCCVAQQLPSLPAGETATVASEQAALATIHATTIRKKGDAVRKRKAEDISIMEAKLPAKVRCVESGKPEPLLIGLLLDMSGRRRTDPLLKSHYDALEADLSSTRGPGNCAFIEVFNDQVYALSKLTADRSELAWAFDQIRKHTHKAPPHFTTPARLLRMQISTA